MASDRPARDEEIEVTEEMKNAGAAILSDRFDQKLDWWTRDIAADVYSAMHEKRYEVDRFRDTPAPIAEFHHYDLDRGWLRADGTPVYAGALRR